MRTNCPNGKAKNVNRLNAWKTACAIFVFCAATATAAPAQTFTTLLSFDGTNGSGPTAVLVQGIDGNLYGTTDAGGVSNGCTLGCGTVLKITPLGTLTRLHSFDFTDGRTPGAGSRPQWELLRNNEHWRGPYLWHGLQDHPQWHADDAVQLLRSNSPQLRGRR